jgi:hypothetical protein
MLFPSLTTHAPETRRVPCWNWNVLAGTADGHVIRLVTRIPSAADHDHDRSELPVPELLAQSAMCIGDGEVRLELFDEQELCTRSRNQPLACGTSVVLAYCDSGAVVVDLSVTPGACTRNAKSRLRRSAPVPEVLHSDVCAPVRGVLHMDICARAVGILSGASARHATLAFVSTTGR